jgi:competence protein ComEC
MENGGKELSAPSNEPGTDRSFTGLYSVSFETEISMRTPLISLLPAYLAGLLLGHAFLYFPYSVCILAALGILTCGILIRFDRLGFRRAAFLSVFCLAGMGMYLFSAAWFPAAHYTRVIKSDKKVHVLVGVISSPLDRDPGRTAFAMDLRSIDGMTVTGTVRVSVREETSSIGYGDTLRVSGKIFSPRGYDNPGAFDYPAFLARSGIYDTVSVAKSGALRVLHGGTGLFRTVQDWRERIRQAFLASTRGPGSAILQAMVLGEEGGLTDELRDRFMDAGVTHIISISGSHLGMVAVLCFGLIRALLFLMPERRYHRLTLFLDPNKIAAGFTLLPVVFYTLLAGGQVATVRSLIMISAGLAALILDRESALMHSLALAALVILLAGPQAILDISFQLSYLSVLVIGYVVSLWNDLGITARTAVQRLAKSAALLMIISAATSLATGPIVAHYFNQFSFAGIVSNMIVVPFAGMIVVPLGLLSGVLSLFMHHLPFAGVNQLVADLFIRVVTFFSRLPYASIHPSAPSAFWIANYTIFLFSCAVCAREAILARIRPLEYSSRVSKGPVVVMALTGVLLLVPTVLPSPSGGTTVVFPDVGQGDCSLIELPSGKNVLIDGGGTRDERFDIGRRVLAPFLWNRGIHRLDLVVLSHPHPDHMNGLKAVLNKFSVREVWQSGLDSNLPGYAEFSRIVRERRIRSRIVSADDRPTVLGGAEVRVLHPARGFVARDRQAYAAENERSLVLRVKSEGKAFLFTGDIGAEAERDLLKSPREVKCDLLKIPHHGSRSSSSDAFVSLARPSVAVVMAGKDNPYHHPTGAVVARYEKYGARLFRTDRDGAITVRVAKNGLTVLRWNDATLTRIELGGFPDWKERERKNYGRLWLRTTAF